MGKVGVAMTTSMPSRARRAALARPIPCAAPVTMAVCLSPVDSIIIAPYVLMIRRFGNDSSVARRPHVRVAVNPDHVDAAVRQRARCGRSRSPRLAPRTHRRPLLALFSHIAQPLSLSLPLAVTPPSFADLSASGARFPGMGWWARRSRRCTSARQPRAQRR